MTTADSPATTTTPAPAVDASRVIAALSERIGQLSVDLAVRDVLLDDLRAQLAAPQHPTAPPTAPPTTPA